MKKRIFSLAVIVMCLSIIGGGTLAYFTDSTTAHNVITTGKVSIELQEWANDEKTTEFTDVDGVMPGESVKKIVEVTNEGESEAWVRVSVTKSIKDASGNRLSADVISIDYDTENWTYNETDGYYYYKDGLAAKETTKTPLFQNVKFSEIMGNDYQNCTVNIDVNAQATQVANNGSSALEAAGWPE